MTLTEYLKTTGQTQQEFAAKLGLTQGTIGHWIHARYKIKPERVSLVEEITDGRVTRYDLRPDLYPRAE